MDHTSVVSTVILSLVILVILLFGIRSMIRRATTGCCGAGENVKTIYPRIGICLTILIVTGLG